MSDTKEPPLSYKESGVDIDAGEALVTAIKPMAKSTARPGADSALGGFGALFDLKAAGYTDPLLVAATDGVGTKLKLALDTGLHGTVGIDLVAMCVNDLVVQGAEPLFFLDYMATGKLDVAQMTDVVAGIAEGCKQAGAALIGGETAEMPGMYSGNDYDLAGFTVGAVERDGLIDGSGVKIGDALLGLTSSGPHSNGYSLIRKVIDRADADLGGPAPFDASQSLGEALLTPTRIYVKSCLAAIRSGGVKALAHITGGGFLENIPRVLPTDCAVHMDASLWSLPGVFSWLQEHGGLSPREVSRTFNCGIGMVLVVDPAQVAQVTQALEAEGETVVALGGVSERGDGPACTVSGPAGLWGSTANWRAASGEA